MLFSFSNPAAGVSEPPGDFNSNYRDLKRLINKALREGTPIEELQLIPRRSDQPQKQLSKQDLLKLLATIRRLKSRYQELLMPPVPKELERDILAKPMDARLPWETEALEKINQWRHDVDAVRAHVRNELNDHLRNEFFKTL